MHGWTHRLQRQVAAGVRSRGLQYFTAHRVRIEQTTPDGVLAKVRGTGFYTVRLKIEDDGLLIVTSCTCPYDDPPCKHVWATLLAAESAGHLQSLAQLKVVPTLLDADESDGGDESFDELEFEPQSRSSTPADKRSRPLPQKPAPPPQWKENLSALRRSAPPLAPPRAIARRILYAVGITECLRVGALVVNVAESSLKKNGEWGKPSIRNSTLSDSPSLDRADRKLLGVIAGSGSLRYSFSYFVETFDTRHRIPAASFDIVVPMLCATGRFYIGEDGLDDLETIRWDDGPPWMFHLKVIRSESGEYTVDGVLRRPDTEIPISAPRLLLAGLVFLPGTAARFDAGDNFGWVSFLRKSGQLRVPAEHAPDLIDEMAQFPYLPPADLPDELRIEPRGFAGPPRLAVRRMDDSRQPAWLQCDLHFNYGEGVEVAQSFEPSSARDSVSGRYFRRDRESEDRALSRLQEFGAKRDLSWRGSGNWELPASRLPALVRTLTPEGWRVEADGKLYRGHASVRVNVTSGIDWLELDGGADFDGQTVKLPELLKALDRGEGMVQLGDGSFGLVPEAWLKRYRLIAGFGKSANGKVRFSHRQASILDALLADEPAATFDEGFRRIRKELDSFAGVQAAAPSAAFTGDLRGYQCEGLGWLQFARRFGIGACLADDMGLGKTVQVLALLASIDREGPVLVVAPRSLVFNWIQETARFVPTLKVLDWSGLSRRGQTVKIQQHDLIVTTYGTLRRDIASLREITFDTVVLDEAQAIKNAATESAKAVRLLTTNNRIALSGTPIENRLSDLWSLCEFLNPGLLGSSSVFREHTAGSSAEESSRFLSKALRPFVLRRTKEKVAKELPAKTEQTIYCELDATQRRLYNELRTHYRGALLGQIEEKGLEKSKMHILEALLRLRQAACHPGLIDKARTQESSAKLDALLPQLEEVLEEGHKAIVFSQFTSLLSIFKKHLDEAKIPYEYLDGKTKNREARVKRFQEDPLCPVFLISLKAGGLGLNLTAAEYVFLLDPWWNPAVEAQAIDRAHRIGQTRHVFAYRLIARDTVEEKVLELQKSKRALADAIITGDNSVLTGLTRENLELLLS